MMRAREGHACQPCFFGPTSDGVELALVRGKHADDEMRIWEQDKQLLTLALSNLREELDAVNNNRLPAGGDVTNLTTFLNTERSSLDSARRAIKGKISAQGQVLLDAFVFFNVKKGIVIYGTN